MPGGQISELKNVFVTGVDACFDPFQTWFKQATHSKKKLDAKILGQVLLNQFHVGNIDAPLLLRLLACKSHNEDEHVLHYIFRSADTQTVWCMLEILKTVLERAPAVVAGLLCDANAKAPSALTLLANRAGKHGDVFVLDADVYSAREREVIRTSNVPRRVGVQPVFAFHDCLQSALILIDTLLEYEETHHCVHVLLTQTGLVGAQKHRMSKYHFVNAVLATLSYDLSYAMRELITKALQRKVLAETDLMQVLGLDNTIQTQEGTFPLVHDNAFARSMHNALADMWLTFFENGLAGEVSLFTIESIKALFNPEHLIGQYILYALAQNALSSYMDRVFSLLDRCDLDWDNVLNQIQPWFSLPADPTTESRQRLEIRLDVRLIYPVLLRANYIDGDSPLCRELVLFRKRELKAAYMMSRCMETNPEARKQVVMAAKDQTRPLGQIFSTQKNTRLQSETETSKLLENETVDRKLSQLTFLPVTLTATEKTELAIKNLYMYFVHKSNTFSKDITQARIRDLCDILDLIRRNNQPDLLSHIRGTQHRLVSTGKQKVQKFLPGVLAASFDKNVGGTYIKLRQKLYDTLSPLQGDGLQDFTELKGKLNTFFDLRGKRVANAHESEAKKREYQRIYQYAAPAYATGSQPDFTQKVHGQMVSFTS